MATGGVNWPPIRPDGERHACFPSDFFQPPIFSTAKNLSELQALWRRRDPARAGRGEKPANNFE
jgi:hypothetical protein